MKPDGRPTKNSSWWLTIETVARAADPRLPGAPGDQVTSGPGSAAAYEYAGAPPMSANARKSFTRRRMVPLIRLRSYSVDRDRNAHRQSLAIEDRNTPRPRSGFNHRRAP